MASNDLDIAGQKAVAEANRHIVKPLNERPYHKNFDHLRPLANSAPELDEVFKAPMTEHLLTKLIGLVAGPWGAPKGQLARYILRLEQRIAALEEQVNGTAR